MVEKFLEYSGVDFSGDLQIIFYDPVFKEDFGPFTKHESYSSVSMNFENGKLEAYDIEGNIVCSCQTKLALEIS